MVLFVVEKGFWGTLIIQIGVGFYILFFFSQYGGWVIDSFLAILFFFTAIWLHELLHIIATYLFGGRIVLFELSWDMTLWDDREITDAPRLFILLLPFLVFIMGGVTGWMIGLRWTAVTLLVYSTMSVGDLFIIAWYFWNDRYFVSLPA